MQNRKRIGAVIAAAVLCICLLLFGSVMLSTRKQITALTDDVRTLRQELRQLESELTGRALYSEEGIDYLAVGNSITVHGVCDYWWTETGMAASEKEKDYYHQIAAWLKTGSPDAVSYAVNLSV